MYRSLLGLVIALGSFFSVNSAQAQFAGESDYEYTVLYEESSLNFADYYYDLYYDFALYIESPFIPGHWEMVGDGPFDTRDEAEYWQSFLEPNYNTYILVIPSTPSWTRTPLRQSVPRDLFELRGRR